MSNLTNISPIDGRYQRKVKELSEYFSEAALMRYRIMVEVKYLLAISKISEISELKVISVEDETFLKDLYQKFSLEDAGRIKEIEKTTNHDVKSVEYFIKEKLEEKGYTSINSEFIHFGLTSNDVNNLSFSLMLKDAIENVFSPELEKLLLDIKELALVYKDVPLLGLTHGQPATPTTVGKEFAIYYARINRQFNNLRNIKLLGKLNGATGNFAAHNIAYNKIDWPLVSEKFINSLGLEANLLTPQIEPHDSMAEVFDNIRRINNIVLDFDRDMWMYISRKIFKQKRLEGEVGSSVMPHKINPINFENSEGNLGIANSCLEFLANKLPISRMQRDLSDSTVIRNQGVAVAHSVLAFQNTIKGLSRLELDSQTTKEELEAHWEVLAEAIQTVLRKVGYEKPYEALKELTRGKTINQESIREFINNLDIPEEEKQKLLDLTPHNYTGLAEKLVKDYL